MKDRACIYSLRWMLNNLCDAMRSGYMSDIRQTLPQSEISCKPHYYLLAGEYVSLTTQQPRHVFCNYLYKNLYIWIIVHPTA